METVTREDLRWELTRVAQKVIDGQRLVCTHRGEPSFALVPLADLERLDELDSRAKKPAKPKR